ncbi:hypothetical protein CQY20_31120 [Mycolicibacterium agri]|uniref:HTH tetR-type domain-containing protein n=1 Tax=Mycolicibacterium agri TaxID=36811 RepID=A0A2A7MNW2_MYCAG|nr:helix-turn-helix domain-containing protein [Mycolicibacterium agri]PEG33376.1 hypothetical protein CQY20_31120 [Mycolicibacterium agri]
MPRNRRSIPRADREDAIVAKVRELFIAKGYRGTSIADVARAAEVAGNAVHWYFPTKDDLMRQRHSSSSTVLSSATVCTTRITRSSMSPRRC